jgi:hypothetical protein
MNSNSSNGQNSSIGDGTAMVSTPSTPRPCTPKNSQQILSGSGLRPFDPSIFGDNPEIRPAMGPLTTTLI